MAVLPVEGVVSVPEHHGGRGCGLGFRFRGRHAHGNHPADSLELLVGFLQIQLQLLNFQILPLQLQLGQGGIEGQQQIALLHLLAFLHQNIGYGLGVRQVDGLNFVRRNRAVALPGVAPIFRHAHIIKAVHLDRVGMVLRQVLPAKKAACAQHCSHCQRNQSALSFTHGCSLLPFSVLRPECDRSYPRIRQWRVRG